ncbi:hypothetical protein MT350_11010 [Rathayibacter sp. VKM Ac-2928]|nr:hypothetical protein [Rathayibacter sp. VKM Ac-2928]
MCFARLSSLVLLQGGGRYQPGRRHRRLLSRLDDEEIATVMGQRGGMESEPLSDVAARFGVVLDEA